MPKDFVITLYIYIALLNNLVSTPIKNSMSYIIKYLLLSSHLRYDDYII